MTDLLSQTVQVLYDTMSGIGEMVAPLTMMIIGARLADLDLKGMFRDGQMYILLFVRLFAVPCMAWLMALPLCRNGIISRETASVLIIISSTPCASLTTVMAELYDCDSVYSSKLVAISTVVSVITMPLIVTLFKV